MPVWQTFQNLLREVESWYWYPGPVAYCKIFSTLRQVQYPWFHPLVPQTPKTLSTLSIWIKSVNIITFFYHSKSLVITFIHKKIIKYIKTLLSERWLCTMLVLMHKTTQQYHLKRFRLIQEPGKSTQSHSNI